MNNEDAVINLFFTFRVFLVGAILLVFSRINRKGLFFGTYLGEEQVEGREARALMRSWDWGVVLVMATSLLLGWTISLSGSAIRGNLTGTAYLILISPLLYFWMYRKARRLAPVESPPQVASSTASLSIPTGADSFAKLALVTCLVVALASAIHATLSLGSMPSEIPSLGSIWGYSDTLVERSIGAVLLFPSYNLVLSVSFALMGLLIASAKRSVRGGSGGRSVEAQERFRIAYSHVFSGSGLSTCFFLTVVSAETIRVWQGATSTIGYSVGLAGIVVILYMGGSLVRLLRLGQGGARQEEGSVDAPLTGGLADNARWILGVVYVDRTDPSVMVESRVWLGYTMNLGNRFAMLLLGMYLSALLGLVVLTLFESRLFT